MKYRAIGAAIAVLLVAGAACSGDDADTAEIDTVNSGGGADEGGADEEGGEPEAEESSDEPGEPAPDEDDSGALLLIMDSSGSMNSRDDDGRALLDGAKDALRSLIGELPDTQHVGLRVYGHTYPNTVGPEQGCTDTELIHPVAPLDRDGLLAAIDSYEASGYTPIGLSLQEAAEDLPPEGPRTIVLVSDGLDTCGDPEPCEAAADLAAQGVEVIINTVGFALDQAPAGEAQRAREQLECIADVGNGTFVDAGDADELADALGEAARDRRSIEMTGGPLEGSLSLRDADTGLPDTRYTDTVLDSEKNYYRFEITPGSQVEAEVVMVGNQDGRCGGGLLQPAVWLVDRAETETWAWRRLDSSGGRDPLDATVITPPAVVEEDEVYLAITPNDSLFDCSDEGQFDVEIELVVLD